MPSKSKPVIQKADARKFINMLIFGSSGVGKTHLIGTAPEDPRTDKVLVIDTERGTSSLRGTNIDVFHAQEIDDFSTIYNFLVNEKHDYNLIVVDSLTETHLKALHNVVDDEVRDNPRRTDELAIERTDYGKSLVQMRRIIRAFRDLNNVHVIFTALAKTESEPREGNVRKPSLIGALGEEVVGMFDITAYYALITPEKGEDPIRRLFLRDIPGVRCKVRTPWGVSVPKYLDNPTFTQILDTWRF